MTIHAERSSWEPVVVELRMNEDEIALLSFRGTLWGRFSHYNPPPFRPGELGARRAIRPRDHVETGLVCESALCAAGHAASNCRWCVPKRRGVQRADAYFRNPAVLPGMFQPRLMRFLSFHTSRMVLHDD